MYGTRKKNLNFDIRICQYNAPESSQRRAFRIELALDLKCPASNQGASKITRVTIFHDSTS